MSNQAYLFTIQVYKRKNEAAKKDYLKALAEYRSGQSSQVSAALCLEQHDVISVQ